jgi:hypothetical protein
MKSQNFDITSEKFNVDSIGQSTIKATTPKETNNNNNKNT